MGIELSVRNAARFALPARCCWETGRNLLKVLPAGADNGTGRSSHEGWGDRGSNKPVHWESTRDSGLGCDLPFVG